MVEIPFWAAELLFTVIWLTVRIAVWIRQRRIDWKREAVLLLMYVNLFVLIRIVFFPAERIEGRIQPLLFDPGAVFPFRIKYVPLVTLFQYDTLRDMLLNVIGNVAIFVPTGIILPILYRKLNSPGKVVFTGFCMSLCIEILQLPFSVRMSDVDDLILNTLGTAAGYLIYSMIKKKTPAS